MTLSSKVMIFRVRDLTYIVKVDDLEGKLNEQIEKSIELSKGLIKAQCEAMYESHARDLTTSDEEKFRTMVEKLDFDGVDDFQDKLVTLKENFFDEDTPVKTPLVEEFAVSEEEAMKEAALDAIDDELEEESDSDDDSEVDPAEQAAAEANLVAVSESLDEEDD